MARAGLHTALDDLDWADLVPRGGLVVWPQAGAEPEALTTSLMAARHDIGGFRAAVGLSLSNAPSRAHADCVDFQSYCGSGTNVALARAGMLDILPVPYSSLADAFGQVDVLLMQVAPRSNGNGYSPGLALEYLAPLLARATTIIAQVNTRLPVVQCDQTLHASDFDLLIYHDAAPLQMRAAQPGETELRIAAHIAGLVEDGATLQAGLGKLPDAILGALTDRRDLGVHSGAIGDWAATLQEAGALTNARKPNDVGISVGGLILGSKRLYDFAHENPAIRLAPTSYTHNPKLLAQMPRYTAINSAIEVDLTGQVNAEIAGDTYVGAVGGAAEFLRGAAASKGGLPIIALPSTVAKTGQSRVVAQLSGPVSTARSEVGLIVTEHGVADLRGKSLGQRRALMLAIAAPQHQAELDGA